MKAVQKQHQRDPNFPHSVLIRIDEFLGMDFFLRPHTCL
jgi:hypothetical protein